MKKFQILLGLTVLVLALYTISAPVNADGKSLIGGWGHYSGCMCGVSHLDYYYCDNRPAPTGGCGGSTFIGFVGGGFDFSHPGPNKACSGGQGYPPFCSDFRDSVMGCPQ